MTTTGYLDTLTGKTTSTTAAATASTGKKTLGQDDFLKLLTTQLKTQDPTAPVDNTQMVAQLAQFSSVAGISEMNASLKTMTTDLAATRIGGASSWIGKSALVPSDIATPLADGSYAGQVTLPSDAKSVMISLTDASGAVVHQQTYPATAAGDIAFKWDGKNASGATAATGPLALTVSAYGATGSAITPTTATWATVASVESPASGDVKLTTALGTVAPTAVLRLS